MSIRLHPSRQTSFLALAILFGTVVGLSGLFADQPVLADQLASRSIEMSDSGVSGGTITTGVGSGTNVSYTISFGLSNSAGYTSGNMKSYIVDFCSDSPIISDTCTAPTGLDLSTATATGGNTAGWTITTTASQIKASDATGIVSGSTVTLEMSGITNPSTLGPFYARIYTYADNTFGSTGTAYTNPQNIGSDVDYGGIALTTVNTVSVSAKVQEEITFCVSGAAFTGNACAGMTTPNLTIGHGSPTLILDASAVDTANAFTQTSTNAQSGAVVRMRDNNGCGGLSDDGGATCAIPPSNAGFTSANTGATTGNAAYGLNVASSTGGIGTMAASAPYNTAGQYNMAFTGAGTGVTSTYGSEIANSSGTGSVSNVDNQLTFAATASNTTPAGIYTATMVLIATGTF
jgi:hypothetical protein